jgi:hypothetical protein
MHGQVELRRAQPQTVGQLFDRTSVRAREAEKSLTCDLQQLAVLVQQRVGRLLQHAPLEQPRHHGADARSDLENAAWTRTQLLELGAQCFQNVLVQRSVVHRALRLQVARSGVGRHPGLNG